MDLSSNTKDFLPAAKTASGGLLRSLLLLTGALLVSGLAGTAGYLTLRLLAPDIPAYSGLLVGLVVLVGVLRWIAARFAWIMPWYYLLPSIIFLLTFTFFPVALTVWLAFTDYSGVRNGQLNSTTEIAIVGVDGTRVTIEDPRAFDCRDLRNGCAGARAVVYASGVERVTAESLEGTTLTLTDPIPAGRTVDEVELTLPDVGIDFTVNVIAAEERTLTLERQPPFPADLAEVTLRLDRNAFEVLMTGDEGDVITLAEPLPEGVSPVAIERYNDFGFIGFRNFRTIMRQATSALAPVFGWNVAFAVLTIVINLAGGVFLAVLLNNPALRFKNVYRTLLIVPWALPSIITIQVWKGFLNQNFGAINRLLMLFDVTSSPINWLGEVWPARAAVLLVNLWLGLPFMMTATLGALSAIPRELYEAAKIDGANIWQSFWGVTAPLLRTALIPITLTGFAFNFNNFNIIFLLTDGGPPVPWGTATARGTDILISWAYNEAFRSQGGFAYGLGSAISILIFIITLAVSLINFRVTGALKEESNA